MKRLDGNPDDPGCFNCILEKSAQMKWKKKKTTLKQMLVLDPACLLYLDNFEEHIQNELGWLLVRFPDPLNLGHFSQRRGGGGADQEKRFSFKLTERKLIKLQKSALLTVPLALGAPGCLVG